MFEILLDCNTFFYHVFYRQMWFVLPSNVVLPEQLTVDLEVERVRAKIARLMPDQSSRTSRVRRARGLPPHVSVLGTGQLLL